jgi:hypothetical protein
MNTQYEANVEKLLVKLLAEIRDLRDDLARRAGQPTMREQKPKPPTPKGPFVASVTKAFGKTVNTTGDDPDVPKQLSEEDQRVMAAQDNEGRLRPGRRVDLQPVEPAEDPTVIRLSDENLKRGGWR